ncbi:hypothetical protein FJM67_05290 [Maribrevibacterium harenarium]|uniref:LPP20 lipoprotein n=1 Tax=Maribrevibacterium harenarium TaxID=2589817 RepID=A0A501X1K7_9GAMM|nr:LPP20 family lipoprotein [Maribrevibacterium harenarium]TPE54359.1 hypothetical protein FJM67_05290 [Maribrevibacterium harenarium]
MIIRQRKALPWLLSGLIGMGLAGCANAPQTKTAPQWLTQPPQNSQFVYGVGSAPVSENFPRAYQVAESNGNGQIAQQLQAEVVQSTETQTRHSMTSEGQNFERVNQLFTQVKTQPLAVTYIRNQERYQDERYVYALQALDRYAAMADLEQQVQSLDQRLFASAATLPNQEQIHESHWRTYFGWIALFAERQDLVEKYQLYAQAPFQSPSDDRIQNQQVLLAKAVAQLSFATEDTALAAALTQMGLQVSLGNQAFFQIRSRQEPTQKQQDKRFYQFLDGEISVMARTGQQGHMTIAARGIGSQQQQAQIKAQQNWGEKGATEIFAWLTQ